MSAAEEVKPRLWPLVVIVACMGYALDLASKLAAVAWLDPQNPPVLLGGLLTLQLVRNPGAAFSMGSNLTVALSIFAIVAFIAVVAFGVPRVQTKWQAVAAGLLLAGIAGNLTDRLFRAPGPLRGHVVDMFQVPHFAIFNVADICITVAAGLIILLSLRSGK